MGKRSRLLGTVGLLAAVAAIVFVSFQRETSLVKRLEDGSFLRIASVEFGNHHKYTLPGLQPWQEFLAKYMPASWRAKLGWIGGTASVGSSGRPGEETLAVTVVLEAAQPTSFYTPQLELRDEVGNRYGLARPGAGAGANAGGRERRLMMWSFNSLPPPGKPLVLRFIYNASGPVSGKTNQQSLDFKVPNPVKPPAI
jgi:hypothetical protein